MINLFVWGWQIPVCYINGDALLPFGLGSVGQQGKVLHSQKLFFSAGVFTGRYLVFKNRFGVKQQPSDQGAFSIIHRARCGKSQQLIAFLVMLMLVVLFLIFSSDIFLVTKDTKIHERNTKIFLFASKGISPKVAKSFFFYNLFVYAVTFEDL